MTSTNGSATAPVRRTRAPRARKPRGKIRYAVVGLGYIAQNAILPAFAHARNSTLAALVSSDPVKRERLGRRFGVDRLHDYLEYDALLATGEVDAVFIALPNAQHAEYANRAARAGVHVLCEKPMATSSDDCESMIRLAAEKRVKLMIAYRLHFEAGNLAAIELARSGRLGELRSFHSEFTLQIAEPDNSRLKAALGGGTLYDIGIYCINAARALFADEPIEAIARTAHGGDDRFSEVEETCSAILRFREGRFATFTASFGSADVSSYRVIGTEGDLRVEPAFSHAGKIVHALTTKGRASRRTFPKRDQFAAELVHFSDCILSDREPGPSGHEGLNDVRVIEALYRSARIGAPVALDLGPPPSRPDPSQAIRRPPSRKPALVHAAGPRGERR